MQSSLKDRLREGLRRTREGLFSYATRVSDLEALEESLISADVGIEATSTILHLAKKRGGPIRLALRKEMVALLQSVSLTAKTSFESTPKVIMVVGVNGVGKTTTVAKLAHYSMASGRQALVVAADTFRAAARRQLAIWAEHTGVKFYQGADGADSAAVVHDALQFAIQGKIDEVFIDTAGRMHSKRPLMEELGKIGRVAGRLVTDAPHQKLLVMEATVGTNGVQQARQFHKTLSIDGIILTKLDGTAKGGVIFAIASALGLPVVSVGIGEKKEDLVRFTPEEFVEALLGQP